MFFYYKLVKSGPCVRDEQDEARMPISHGVAGFFPVLNPNLNRRSNNCLYFPRWLQFSGTTILLFAINLLIVSTEEPLGVGTVIDNLSSEALQSVREGWSRDVTAPWAIGMGWGYLRNGFPVKAKMEHGTDLRRITLARQVHDTDGNIRAVKETTSGLSQPTAATP